MQQGHENLGDIIKTARQSAGITVEKLAEQAGVRKLNFHALRHTFAMRAIECGMDVKVIAEILGHKNASITLNRYAHCMLDHKIEMMHKLPRVL